MTILVYLMSPSPTRRCFWLQKELKEWQSPSVCRLSCQLSQLSLCRTQLLDGSVGALKPFKDTNSLHLYQNVYFRIIQSPLFCYISLFLISAVIWTNINKTFKPRLYLHWFPQDLQPHNNWSIIKFGSIFSYLFHPTEIWSRLPTNLDVGAR